MAKIIIKKIEHIPWAKRIIIDFYVTVGPSDPAKGGWVYLLSSCGYRGVCDDEWIVMEPNWQHPLHSDTIIAPGDNKFVWDYLGVQGLNPQDFDSEHSYVVQIACVDSSCDWVDPCDQSQYKTPDSSPTPGVEPAGTVGTKGDANNTNNNCGPDYELLEDEFGCLYCALCPGGGPGGDPPTPGGGGTYWVPWPGRPPGWSGPPVPNPPRPGNPGGGKPPGGGGVPRPGGPGGPGTPGPSGPGVNKPGAGAPWTPGGGGPSTPRPGPDDRPPSGPVSPGPRSPSTPGGPNDTVPPGGGGGAGTGPVSPGGHDLGGVVDGEPFFDIFADDAFYNPDITDDGDPGADGPIVGHDRGGREASFGNKGTIPSEMNALSSTEMLYWTSVSSMDWPSKAALDVSPRSAPVPAQDNPTNRTPNKLDQKKPTSITDAINIQGGIISIGAGKNTASVGKEIQTQNPKNLAANAKERKKLDTSFPDAYVSRGANFREGGTLRRRGQEIHNPTQGGSTGRGKLGDRRSAPRLRREGNIPATKNSSDWHGNYDLKTVVAPVGVDRVFVEARLNIVPKAVKTARVTVYLLQNEKSRILAQTKLTTRDGPRFIGITAPLKEMIPGKNCSVLVAVDDGSKVVGTKVHTFKVPDHGAAKMFGSTVPQGNVTQQAPVEALVKPSASMELAISPNQPRKILARAQQLTVGDLVLAAYTTSNRHDVQHAISIFNREAASKVTGIPAQTFFPGTQLQNVFFSEAALVEGSGLLDFPGLDLKSNKYGGVCYGKAPLSKLTGFASPAPLGHLSTASFMIIVSSAGASRPSRATLSIGPTMEFVPFSVTSAKVDPNSELNISFTSPYADTKHFLYDAGGNGVVPSSVTTYEVTTGLDGTASIIFPITQQQAWIGVAVDGPFTLYERTIKWVQVT